MKTRFAVTPPASALSGPEFPHYLARAESLSFDTVWLSDIPLGAFGDPLLSLAFAAGKTSRIKLGANIVPLGRNPLWIAKQIAQLDRLSNGRALISFVPGLAQPGERPALGHSTGDRGKVLEEMMALLRCWWAGEPVAATFGEFSFEDIRLAPQPVQEPLEIWLGGKSQAALDRVARCADGWLTAAMSPDEAAQGRAEVVRRAGEYGREIDPEHFGVSLPYSKGPPSATAVATLAERRKDGDVSEVLAIGAGGLSDLVQAYQAAGFSKFVVRPVERSGSGGDWIDELDWLADTVLPLQT